MMRTMLDFAARHLPLVAQLRAGMSRADLRADFVAGLTTAVMLIPQGMAYAMLAGLPPIVGLYASLLPLVVYALLGTSRQLAVGPVAMDSLLVASGVGAIAEGGSEAYIAYAAMLAVMAGGIQIVLGLVRAGAVAKLLTRPVISGFSSAAALIIGLSQLGPLLGVTIERSAQVHVIVLDAVTKLASVDPLTLGLGLTAIAALAVLKIYAPDLPRALIVVTAATLAVLGLGLDGRGVATVGEVPAGLPSFAWPELGAESSVLETLGKLAPTALAIAVIGFMEAFSVAEKLAREQDYALDANRELVALGAANLLAGLFRGYPVTGGFSRTAVNAQAGARSGLAGLVTAAVVTATLLVLTPLFEPLPKAALAAIIMVAVMGLVDLAEPRRLWSEDRWGLGVLALTFGVTLTQGIQLGIAIGVAAAQLVGWFRRTPGAD